MPDINPGRNAYLKVDNESTWAAARDVASAESISTNPSAAYPQVSGYSNKFDVHRVMMAFDTSGITDTVASATLNIRGHNYNTAILIVVKVAAGATGDSSTNFVLGDFDAIDGFVSGASMNGNVTDYSSSTTSWSTSGYNNITLNSSALTDLKNLSEFKLAIVEYECDYPNVAIGAAQRKISGMRCLAAGVGKLPYITYALGASGYENNVDGVASANISKVVGVATADINKINGV